MKYYNANMEMYTENKASFSDGLEKEIKLTYSKDYIHQVCMDKNAAYKVRMEGERQTYCTKEIMCYATQCETYFPLQAYKDLKIRRKSCEGEGKEIFVVAVPKSDKQAL